MDAWGSILGISTTAPAVDLISGSTSDSLGVLVWNRDTSLTESRYRKVHLIPTFLGGRVGYSFSTDLFTKLYVQWNSDRNLITTNFLVNYIYSPGSDFYFVFNQTYGTDSMTSGLLDTTVVGKVTYWWNP